MGQQWRVRITGKQHKTVDIDVLVQAVIALGRQLSREQQTRIDIPAHPEQLDDKPQGSCS